MKYSFGKYISGCRIFKAFKYLVLICAFLFVCIMSKGDKVEGSAYIGNTYYSSLQKAVDALSSTSTKTITLGSNENSCPEIYGKKGIIDLNGYTLSCSSEYSRFIVEDSTITVKNGTIKNGTKMNYLINIQSITDKATTVKFYDVNITNNSSEYGTAIAIYVDEDDGKAVYAYFYGGKIFATTDAIDASGSAKVELYVYDGTEVIARRSAFNIDSESHAYLYGGTFVTELGLNDIYGTVYIGNKDLSEGPKFYGNDLILRIFAGKTYLYSGEFYLKQHMTFSDAVWVDGGSLIRDRAYSPESVSVTYDGVKYSYVFATKYIAENNGTKYVTLQAAVNAMGSTETSNITLLGDANECITIDNKKGEINLNGFTVTCSSGPAFTISNSSNILINNGTIINSGTSGLTVDIDSSTVKFDSLTMKNSSSNTSNGVIEIYNSTVEMIKSKISNPSKSGVSGVVVRDSTLTLQDSKLYIGNANYALTSTGSEIICESDSNISGLNITGGTFTMEYGNITGGKYGIYVNSGIVNIGRNAVDATNEDVVITATTYAIYNLEGMVNWYSGRLYANSSTAYSGTINTSEIIYKESNKIYDEVTYKVMNFIQAVAKINTTYYSSLVKALDALTTTSKTVTLLSGACVEEDYWSETYILKNKKAIIDFSDYESCLSFNIQSSSNITFENSGGEIELLDLEDEDGDITPSISSSTVAFINTESISIDNIKNSTVTIAASEDERNPDVMIYGYIFGSSKLTLNKGTYNGFYLTSDTTSYPTLIINGGKDWYGIEVEKAAKIEINGGEVDEISQPMSEDEVERTKLDLTITGGNVGDIDLEFITSGTFKFSGGSIDNVWLGGVTSMTISGGNIDYISIEKSADIEMSEGYVGGFEINDTTLEISGGEVDGEIIATEDSNVTISGGKINDRIELEAGTLKITGGEIFGDVQMKPNDEEGGKLTMNGGIVYRTVELWENSTGYIYNGKIYKGVDVYETASLTVGSTSNTYYPVILPNGNKSSSYYGVDVRDGGTFKFYSGFIFSWNSDNAYYCDSEYSTCTINSSIKTIHAYDEENFETGYLFYEGYEYGSLAYRSNSYYAKIGSKLYTSLSGAISALSSSTSNTITLLRPVTSCVSISGKVGVIDLNGFSINCSSSTAAIAIKDSSNITIMNGTVSNKGKGDMIDVTSSTLTLQDVKIVKLSEQTLEENPKTIDYYGVDINGDASNVYITSSIDGESLVLSKVRVNAGKLFIEEYAYFGNMYVSPTEEEYYDIEVIGGEVNVYNGNTSIKLEVGTVNVYEYGDVRKANVSGGILNVFGGRVGDILAYGGEVNITGGIVETTNSDLTSGAIYVDGGVVNIGEEESSSTRTPSIYGGKTYAVYVVSGTVNFNSGILYANSKYIDSYYVYHGEINCNGTIVVSSVFEEEYNISNIVLYDVSGVALVIDGEEKIPHDSLTSAIATLDNTNLKQIILLQDVNECIFVENKKGIINLNGHVIHCSDRAITIDTNSEIQFENGSVINSNNNEVNISSSTSLVVLGESLVTLHNVNIISNSINTSIVVVDENAVLNIEGNTDIHYNESLVIENYMTQGILSIFAGATVNMYGGEIKDSYSRNTSAVVVFGTMNLYGGLIISEANENGGAIMLSDSNCEFNMYGGLVKGFVGIVASMGNANIYKGIIVGTQSHGIKGAPKVIGIEGEKINNELNIYGNVYGIYNPSETITIWHNGIIYGNEQVAYSGNISSPEIIETLGGTYETDQGTYTVMSHIRYAVAKLEHNGGITYYDTLKEATDALIDTTYDDTLDMLDNALSTASKKTIYLLRDTNECIVMSSHFGIIDLNGFTVTCEKNGSSDFSINSYSGIIIRNGTLKHIATSSADGNGLRVQDAVVRLQNVNITTSYNHAIRVRSNSRLEINGGIITSPLNQHAIYVYDKGYLKFNSGVIKGGITGIFVASGGKVDLLGGTVVALSKGTSSSNGHAVYSSGTLNIGIDASNGPSIYGYKYGVYRSNGKTTFNGGKLYGGVDANNAYTKAYYGSVTVSVDIESQTGISHAYDGVTYTVTSYSLCFDDYAAKIEDTYYNSLQKAINDLDATVRKTIVLIKNVKESVTISGKVGVIDLNGYSITYNGNNTIIINSSSNIEFINSNDSVKGIVDNTSAKSSLSITDSIVKIGENLVFKNSALSGNLFGTIDVSKSTLNINGSEIYNDVAVGIWVKESSTINMNSGLIISYSYSIRGYIGSNKIININGGTVVSTRGNAIYNDDGSTTINIGKELLGDSPSLYGYSYTITDVEDTKLNFYFGNLYGGANGEKYYTLWNLDSSNAVTTYGTVEVDISSHEYNGITYTSKNYIGNRVRIDNTYYTSIQDAINALDNVGAAGAVRKTIVLLGDTRECVTISGKLGVIDLNNHFFGSCYYNGLSTKQSYIIIDSFSDMVIENGKLSVNDMAKGVSVTNSNVEINNINIKVTATNAIIVNEGAHVDIDNVNISSGSDGVVVNGGEVNINNVLVNSGSESLEVIGGIVNIIGGVMVSSSSKGTIYVTGGIVNIGGEGASKVPSIYGKTYAIFTTGGTVNFNEGNLYADEEERDSSISSAYSGNVNVPENLVVKIGIYIYETKIYNIIMVPVAVKLEDGENVTYYLDLQEAIVAMDGETSKKAQLLKSLILPQYLEIKEKLGEIDLNGYTLKGTSVDGSSCMIIENSNIILRNGEIICEGSKNDIYALNIKNSTVNMKEMSVAAINIGAIKLENTILTIDSSEIEATAQVIHSTGGGTITINGGSITSSVSDAINIYPVQGTVEININTGRITSNMHSLYLDKATYKATITINGGEIKAQTSYPAIYSHDTKHSIVVNGGIVESEEGISIGGYGAVEVKEGEIKGKGGIYLLEGSLVIGREDSELNENSLLIRGENDVVKIGEIEIIGETIKAAEGVEVSFYNGMLEERGLELDRKIKELIAKSIRYEQRENTYIEFITNGEYRRAYLKEGKVIEEEFKDIVIIEVYIEDDEVIFELTHPGYDLKGDITLMIENSQGQLMEIEADSSVMDKTIFKSDDIGIENNYLYNVVYKKKLLINYMTTTEEKISYEGEKYDFKIVDKMADSEEYINSEGNYTVMSDGEILLIDMYSLKTNDIITLEDEMLKSKLFGEHWNNLTEDLRIPSIDNLREVLNGECTQGHTSICLTKLEIEFTYTNSGEIGVAIINVVLYNYAPKLVDNSGGIIGVEDMQICELGSSCAVSELSFVDYRGNDVNNVETVVTLNNVVVNKVDSNVLGDYIVKTKAMDMFGNVSEVLRVYKVIDVIAPVVEIDDRLTIIKKGEVFKEFEIIASDNYDKDLIIERITGDINVNKVGTYKIGYKVSDSSGNYVIVYRTLVVKDNNHVILYVLGALTILSGLVLSVLAIRRRKAY